MDESYEDLIVDLNLDDEMLFEEKVVEENHELFLVDCLLREAFKH